MSAWLVIYDIADDRRRSRIAATLEAYGPRVQYSSFELDLPQRDFSKVLQRLMREMDPHEDSLRCYPVHPEARRQIRHIGAGPEPFAPPPDCLVL